MNASNSGSAWGPLEIITTRGFGHPRELVFDAFAEPKQLARWWGPNGFTNTIERFELRPGGTELTWHMKLDAHPENAKWESFIRAANEQNFDRLAAHLGSRATPN